MITPFGRYAPDLQWQLWLGHTVAQTHRIPHAFGPEAFAVSGTAWHPDSWLASLAAWLIFHSHGYAALTSVSLLFAAASLVLVGLRALQRGLSDVYTALAIVLAAGCLAGGSFVGIDSLSWFFFALSLYAIEASSERTRFLAPVTILVWAQFDGRALFGALFAVAMAFGLAVSRRAGRNELRSRAVLAAVSVCAVFLTPMGFATPLGAPAILHLDSVLPWAHRVAPWELPNHAFVLGVFALVVLAGCYGMRRDHRIMDAVQFSLALALALVDGRNAPFFGIVAAPMVFQSIAQYYRVRAVLRPSGLMSKTRLIVAVGIAAIVIAVTFSQRTPAQTAIPPEGLVTRLSADNASHRVFCATIRWCDAITTSGDPRLHVFMDGRDGAFPDALRKEQKAVTSVEGGWRDTLRRRRVDVIVTEPGTVLASMLGVLTHEWRELPRAGSGRIYERVTESAAQ